MTAVPAPDPGPDAGATWHYGDPLGEQRAASIGAVVVDRSHRAVLTVTGGDRLGWLHNISSQHISALPEGATVANLSLDGQGRVEDHWIQTEFGGVSYLDTEGWRGQPLLDYLQKMVFWSDVQPQATDLGVLTLLGPGLAEPAVLAALGIDALPTDTALPVTGGSAGAGPLPRGTTPLVEPGGGFVRRMPVTRSMPGSQTLELDLVVPRADVDDWLARLSAAGVRPAGTWAYEAHRVAAAMPRLGVDTDERTIPHEVGWIGGPGEGAVHLDKGCYRGQETVARVHNLGRPPRMLVLLHLDGSVDRPATGDAVTAGGRPVGRIGTVVDHADLGPVALALVKRTVGADTELLTSGAAAVAARIDPDSMPAAEGPGAGRVAVDRLRGGPQA